MEEKKLTPEEIDKIERNVETIFAIEGMEFTDEEKEMGRKYLAGEISLKEYQGHFLKK